MTPPYRYIVNIEDRLEAAHQLDLPYESKCNRLHGHCYRIRVTIAADMLDANGMVVDFVRIKDILRSYDHQNLNEYFTPSTAEKFAEILLDQIQNALPKWNPHAQVLEVGVGETATTMVVAQFSNR